MITGLSVCLAVGWKGARRLCTNVRTCCQTSPLQTTTTVSSSCSLSPRLISSALSMSLAASLGPSSSDNTTLPWDATPPGVWAPSLCPAASSFRCM